MKFLESVKDKIKQVTWLSGKQPHKGMLVITETSIIFGLMPYVMDITIQSLFGWILR